MQPVLEPNKRFTTCHYIIIIIIILPITIFIAIAARKVESSRESVKIQRPFCAIFVKGTNVNKE